MRVAILFNAISEQAKTDELDVLVQLEAVSASLGRLGHESVKVPCGLDVRGIVDALDAFKPHAVFNLVECLDGYGRLIFLVPAVLDARGVGYTGSPAEALFLTSHKVLAKERIRAAGLHPSHSDLPILCTKLGISYESLIDRILRSALARTEPEAAHPHS